MTKRKNKPSDILIGGLVVISVVGYVLIMHLIELSFNFAGYWG